MVRVPTPAQEAARWPSRQREQLLRERKRLEAQGRSLLLTQGLRVKGHWWQPKHWQPLAARLPAALATTLAITREIVQLVHEKVQTLTAELEAAAAPGRAKGVGALTTEVMRREIGDWRALASSSGRQLHGVVSSGAAGAWSTLDHQTGNPDCAPPDRVGLALVNWQPHYPPVARWRALLLDKKTPSGRKKKAIVAIGRHLAIDLWRLATGRCRAQQLQLVVAG